eukprot:gene12055-biopygen3297
MNARHGQSAWSLGTPTGPRLILLVVWALDPGISAPNPRTQYGAQAMAGGLANSCGSKKELRIRMKSRRYACVRSGSTTQVLECSVSVRTFQNLWHSELSEVIGSPERLSPPEIPWNLPGNSPGNSPGNDPGNDPATSTGVFLFQILRNNRTHMIGKSRTTEVIQVDNFMVARTPRHRFKEMGVMGLSACYGRGVLAAQWQLCQCHDAAGVGQFLVPLRDVQAPACLMMLTVNRVRVEDRSACGNRRQASERTVAALRSERACSCLTSKDSQVASCRECWRWEAGLIWGLRAVETHRHDPLTH